MNPIQHTKQSVALIPALLLALLLGCLEQEALCQNTNRFYYDSDDRLIGAEYSRGISIAYTYDGNGNIVRQTVLSRGDEATNGMPVLWRFLNGLTNSSDSNLYADPDGDGWSNYQEWLAGSKPSNSNSVPNLLGNPGTNIASLTMPFPPSNFVLAVGQLDGFGAEEIVVGADGSPGTNSNFLLVLTQGVTTWSTQRVGVGPFGITSIAVGQPANRPSVGIYVGLRGTTNVSGRVMEFTTSGGIWQSNLVALSTNEAAFVAGMRGGTELLVSLATNGNSTVLLSLTSTNGAWTTRTLSTNVSNVGLASVLDVFSAYPRQATARLLDSSQIELLSSGVEFFKNGQRLPDNAAYNPATGRWYFRSLSESAWPEAQSRFLGIGVNLVMDCLSEVENNWIKATFSNATYWVGMYAGNIGGSLPPYYWADGRSAGDSIEITWHMDWLWAGGSPSFPGDPGPFYTYMNQGGWRVTTNNLFTGLYATPSIDVFSNQWMLPLPSATKSDFWRGAKFCSSVDGSSETRGFLLSGAFVDDKNLSNGWDAGDDFVVFTYLVQTNNWVTNTLVRIPLEATVNSYALTWINFLPFQPKVLFTAEPSGAIYSWSATNASATSQRQLFTADYLANAWHALAGVKSVSGGEGLVGLMVDPTNQNSCSLIFWPPQAVLSSPQTAVVETAPAAAVLPATNTLSSLAVVTVRLWDAEGNASTPFLQYQFSGSTNWQDATLTTLDGIPYTLAARVSAPPGGANHTVVWNALTDLGPGLTINVLLRVRASDMTLLGDWSLPTLFAVNTTADSDGNGLPDAWELQYFVNLSQLASDDFDHDSFSNWGEYIADTNPTNAASYLHISAATVETNGVRIWWQGGVQARQIVQRRLDLVSTNSWINLQTNEPPTPQTNSFLDAFNTNASGYYRIKVERP